MTKRVTSNFTPVWQVLIYLERRRPCIRRVTGNPLAREKVLIHQCDILQASEAFASGMNKAERHFGAERSPAHEYLRTYIDASGGIKQL